MTSSRKFDWNDLRYFLAIARYGSTVSAAKELNLSQSTVHRRLDELEKRLGRQLVKRHPTGYRLTPLGEDMLVHAQRVEAAIDEFDRRLHASSSDLTGQIRITCPEAFGPKLMYSGLIEKFNEAFPGLQLEFLIGGELLDLAKGEADIAIRAMEPTENYLFGRKIGDSPWAIYASRSYIEKNGSINSVADVDKHAVVLFDGDLKRHRAAHWMQSVAPKAKVAARSSNLAALILAVKSGTAIAPMPMTVEYGNSELIRMLGPLPDLSTPMYLLMHEDMRQTPRVRAFFDFVVKEVSIIRRLLNKGF